MTKKNHGITGAGDVIEMLAKPIAKLMKIPCLDAEGKLRVGSGCAQRRDAMNKMLPL